MDIPVIYDSPQGQERCFTYFVLTFQFLAQCQKHSRWSMGFWRFFWGGGG